MKELTYADIRKMALEHGIKDTRLHIGLWATDRYVKKRKMVHGKTYTIYLPHHKSEQEWFFSSNPATKLTEKSISSLHKALNTKF